MLRELRVVQTAVQHRTTAVSSTVHIEYRPYYDDSKQQAVMLRQLI